MVCDVLVTGLAHITTEFAGKAQSAAPNQFQHQIGQKEPCVSNHYVVMGTQKKIFMKLKTEEVIPTKTSKKTKKQKTKKPY